MDTVVLTDLIAELHQLFDTLLVGMILLPILEADRIDYKMRMNVLSVNMSCDYNFIFVERFLCKLNSNLVGKFRVYFVSAGEALHQMIVKPPVVFVIEILGRGHFIERSLGRAVNSCHETLVF